MIIEMGKKRSKTILNYKVTRKDIQEKLHRILSALLLRSKIGCLPVVFCGRNAKFLSFLFFFVYFLFYSTIILKHSRFFVCLFRFSFTIFYFFVFRFFVNIMLSAIFHLLYISLLYFIPFRSFLIYTPFRLSPYFLFRSQITFKFISNSQKRKAKEITFHKQ